MNLKEIRLTRIAAMMIIGCVIGFALLAAVYCLPLDTLRDAEGTAAIFREEGNRPAAIPGYPGSTGDGYTDALMITEALFHDPAVGPLEQAVKLVTGDGVQGLQVFFPVWMLHAGGGQMGKAQLVEG